MRRREFIRSFGSAVAAWPLTARAQGINPTRVGYLFTSKKSEGQSLWEACRQGLRELGYREGENIILEPRWTEGRQEQQLPSLVNELLGLNVAILVTAATPASLAAKAATNITPIVFVAVADPVSVGLVASLAHPGANVTGLSLLTSDLSGKRLELLREIVRKIGRVAILMNPDNPSNTIFLKQTQIAAQGFGIELDASNARRPEDIEKAFAAAEAQHVDALIVFDDPALWSYRTQIVSLAAAHKLPAMYGYSDFVTDGGLMSYGPDRPDKYRRTAIYVDKILRGTKPADLPVEQPVKFQLIVNRKTAESLGLSLPPPIEVSADRVVE
jgi:putative tryptophan/tyrosine transport system substrate-binding protein